MKRTIIAGTILLLLALFIGSVMQVDSTLLSLSAQTAEYDVIRMTLIALLIGLLFTSPPRSIHFRIVLAAMSAALFIGSLGMALNYSLGYLDAIVFIEVAIIFALEATEASLLEPLQTTKKTSRAA